MSERWPQIIVVAASEELDRLEQVLFEAGALSVTAEDAGDEPILEPAPGTTPLWQKTRLRALFDRDTALGPLRQRLERDCPSHRFSIDESLADRDWVREWMVHFQPMRFGQRLWILPQHICADTAGGGEDGHDPIIVRLDPGLAFGTGTHPSTASCLRWLDGERFCCAGGARVLDYGCGSGVLAVAAAKLGASRVCAVDLDPQALVATDHNARSNGVRERLSIVAPGQLAACAYDLVVANILAGPLISLAPRLALLVRPGGRLKLAGILCEQVAAVVEAYEPWFEVNAKAIDEQWASVQGSRKRA